MEERALTILAAIWRGLSPAYKSRYRLTIWRQFEDQVRSAAYTSSLSRFVNCLCSKLDVVLAAKDVAAVEAALTAGADRAMLKLLREETTLLVLQVRVANQERREAYEATLFENENEEDSDADLSL